MASLKTGDTVPFFDVYHDHVWVPYAVEVGGQIISVYAPVVHERIDELFRATATSAGFSVGGLGSWSAELTIEMLDLRLDPTAKSYEAPIQMKANNGVLIVDDFGRQLYIAA